jgi:hypothetical protein
MSASNKAIQNHDVSPFRAFLHARVPGLLRSARNDGVIFDEAPAAYGRLTLFGNTPVINFRLSREDSAESCP